jgi:hypothetical protein
MIVGFVVLLTVVKNPNFKKWLDSLIKTGTQQLTPPPPSGGGQQQPPPPGSGGSTATGQHVYAAGSGTCSGTDGSQSIGCSGGQTHSERHDFDSCQLTNYEATAILNYNASSCGCGDEFDVKLGGPGHSDGNCCWWLIAVNNDGSGGITTGGEGPHPDTTKDSKEGVIVDSVGSVDGKKVGLKGVTWDNGNGTRHFEGWVDVTGSGTSWQKVAEQDLAEWGNNEKTGTIASDQQVEFRCDCDGVSWEAADVIEIQPGVLASGGGTTTPPPATTPPAEEEDDEEEDGGGDGNGGITPAPPSTTCPSRCEPLRNSPASYQACCSGTAGGARSRRRRARAARAMYGNMIDRFGAYNFKYDSYRYRHRDGKLENSQLEFGIISPRTIRVGNLR